MTNEDTIPALLKARAQASPGAVAFAYQVGEVWQEIRWGDFMQRVERLASNLKARGLEPGEHVGILAPTSLEWELMHHAVLFAGAVVVGLEPHDTAERLQTIAEHADLNVLVVGSRELLKKLSEPFLARLKLVVLVEGGPEASDGIRICAYEELSETSGNVADGAAASDPKAFATLIYTSGTTGQPKGILYRHDQVTLAVRAIAEAYPSLPVGSRFVCWLPLSNLFQRIMNLAAVATGGTVYLVSNPLMVLKALPYAKPDVFIGVPRFYEKLHAGIMQEIERKPAVIRNLIRGALDIGDRFASARRSGRKVAIALRVAHRLVDSLVLRRLRKVMGGRVRFMVTGSAPTPVRLLEFFDAIGLPLYEAYGLSENVVPMALSRPGDAQFGTVGRQLSPNELRLDEDGELLVRGQGVFSGYYKDNRTSELFTGDGFYRTGDYASFNEQGMLMLNGRKSDIIKTSTGRRISPIQIEAHLEKCSFVDRAVVLGAGRKCLVAIVCLKNDSTSESGESNVSIPRIRPEVLQALDNELEECTRPLPDYMKPGGYLLLTRPFSIESGELTPNLKLRRRVVEQRYAADIDKVYDAIGRQDSGAPVIATIG